MGKKGKVRKRFICDTTSLFPFITPFSSSSGYWGFSLCLSLIYLHLRRLNFVICKETPLLSHSCE